MTTSCHFCAREIGHAVVRATGDGNLCVINGNHWTGTEYVRVDYCGHCAADKRVARAPRRTRQPATYVATDWNMLVAFTKGAKRSDLF